MLIVEVFLAFVLSLKWDTDIFTQYFIIIIIFNNNHFLRLKPLFWFTPLCIECLR